MNLHQTNKSAGLRPSIPCRKCGKPTELANCTEWNDYRTLSYCEIENTPLILHLIDRADSPDVMLDIYQCPVCDEYTADLDSLLWMDEQGNFRLWQDADKIEIAPGQLKLL